MGFTMRRLLTLRYVPTISTLAVVLLTGASCADRLSGEEDEIDAARDEGEVPDEGAGGSGLLYASCSSVSECGALDYCLKPVGEVGFCTLDCNIDEECSLAGDVDGRCETVQGDQICAIDCGDSKCPMGMSCERVELEGRERKLCF